MRRRRARFPSYLLGVGIFFAKAGESENKALGCQERRKDLFFLLSDRAGCGRTRSP